MRGVGYEVRRFAKESVVVAEGCRTFGSHNPSPSPCMTEIVLVEINSGKIARCSGESTAALRLCDAHEDVLAL